MAFKERWKGIGKELKWMAVLSKVWNGIVPIANMTYENDFVSVIGCRWHNARSAGVFSPHHIVFLQPSVLTR